MLKYSVPIKIDATCSYCGKEPAITSKPLVVCHHFVRHDFAGVQPITQKVRPKIKTTRSLVEE